MNDQDNTLPNHTPTQDAQSEAELDELDLEAPVVACATERGVPQSYWKRFSCYEMSNNDLNAKPATLRKWREGASEGARFIARVDPRLATLGFEGAEAEELWRHALLRQEALQAEVILLHTPSSYRPSSEAIAALRRFFSTTPLPCTVAWRADGLWEESETYVELCEELGLIPAIDPLMWDEDEPMPRAERFYWRILGGQGLSPRVNELDLERLIDLADDLGTSGWVVFTSPQMERDAKRFKAMVGDF